MPTPDFYTILTKVGAAQITNAQALGTAVQLTEIAVGDGNGAYTDPTEDTTALTNEVWRGAVNRIEQHESEPGYLVIETVIPSDVGGWEVREVGVFDDAGNLIAAGKIPATFKPELTSGSGRDLFIRLIVAVGSASAVTLKIDPSVVLATRDYVDRQNRPALRYYMS